MQKEYHTRGFSNDEEFMTHHQALAARGEPDSQSVVDTRERIEQAEMRRKTAERLAAMQAVGGECE